MVHSRFFSSTAGIPVDGLGAAYAYGLLVYRIALYAYSVVEVITVFWFICIAFTVVISIGVLIGLWLRLLEDERQRKQAGAYALWGSIILIITTVLTYQVLLIK